MLILLLLVVLMVFIPIVVVVVPWLFVDELEFSPIMIQNQFTQLLLLLLLRMMVVVYKMTTTTTKMLLLIVTCCLIPFELTLNEFLSLNQRWVMQFWFEQTSWVYVCSSSRRITHHDDVMKYTFKKKFNLF